MNHLFIWRLLLRAVIESYVNIYQQACSYFQSYGVLISDFSALLRPWLGSWSTAHRHRYFLILFHRHRTGNSGCRCRWFYLLCLMPFMMISKEKCPDGIKTWIFWGKMCQNFRKSNEFPSFLKMTVFDNFAGTGRFLVHRPQQILFHWPGTSIGIFILFATLAVGLKLGTLSWGWEGEPPPFRRGSPNGAGEL